MAIVISILLAQMLEFRVRFLTCKFTIILSFYVFILFHLPELIALVSYLGEPTRIGYAILHKLIEVVPLTAFSSSVLLNGRKKCCCAYFTLIFLIFSVYLSRFINQFSLSIPLAPFVIYFVILLFPYTFSSWIAGYLLDPDYRDLLRDNNQHHFNGFSDVAIFLLFSIYCVILLIFIYLIEMKRKDSVYLVSRFNPTLIRDSQKFGECLSSRNELTNQYVEVNSSQLSYWDRLSSFYCNFGFPNLTVD